MNKLLLTLLCIISINIAKAQIVYTDLNPDILLSCDLINVCSESDSIDLNNDGIHDFTLQARETLIQCTCTNVLMGTNDYATVNSTSLSWIADKPGGYALNSLIDSSLNWINASHDLAWSLHTCTACGTGGGMDMSYSGKSGNWLNSWGRYLPLKIQVGTDFYYGWIKLGIAVGNGVAYSGASITIMSYAYNSIPNQPILAGQTTATGITENSFAQSINLFPNPATNHLTITLGSSTKKVQVTIADITGKVIYTTLATDIQKIEVNTKDFTAGIYVVQIQTADFIATKRFIVEK